MAAEATACVVEVVQGLAEGARVQHPARQHPGIGVLEADSAMHQSSTRVTLHRCEWPCAYDRAVAMVPRVEKLAAGRARLEAVGALQHESWGARDVQYFIQILEPENEKLKWQECAGDEARRSAARDDGWPHSTGFQGGFIYDSLGAGKTNMLLKLTW
ncbi:hypothetical protein ZWY2020_034514 [Hordeum vulgare]|nr:hypothetical protein ZWY2020_034514 [Hordeum vulgare]